MANFVRTYNTAENKYELLPEYRLLPVSADDGDGLLYNVSSGLWEAGPIGGSGLQYFDENRNVATPNATVPAHQIIAKGTETNIDIVLSPKGEGAIVAQVPDGTTAGGNKRGNFAVDWQSARNVAARVASGSYSVISGGNSNIASGSYSVISGGIGNFASGLSTVVSGGGSNDASGQAASIGGGSENTASGTRSSVCGGYRATAQFTAQEAYAGGRFSIDADAQRSDYIMRGKTKVSNAYRLYLDGSTELINLDLIGTYASWYCKLKVTGLRRQTGAVQHFASEHNFLIEKNNTTITIAIANIQENYIKQTGGSTIGISIDVDTNNRLRIECATSDDNWQFVGHLETVETFSNSLT